MNKQKTYGIKKSKFLKFVSRCFLVIAFIVALFTVEYFRTGARVKEDIRTQVTPMVREMTEQWGAERVEVIIRAEPEGSATPGNLEFHIFLRAYYTDLRTMDQETALYLLRNGDEDGDKEYSYSYDRNDYAIYTRRVQDTVNGKQHPVFVTLTDGSLHYSLEDGSWENHLCTRDTYRMLAPPSIHSSAIVAIGMLIAAAAMMIWIKYREITRQAAIEDAGLRFYRVCRNAGVDADSPANADQIRQLGQASGVDKTVKKFDSVWQELFRIGAAQASAIGGAVLADTAPGEGMASIMRRVEAAVAEEQALVQKEQKKMRKCVTAVIIAVVVVVAVLAGSILAGASGKASRYNQAVELLNAGDADGAYTIFEELGAYKDSREQCLAIDYTRADAYEQAGEYTLAYTAFSALDDYSDASGRAAALREAYPQLAVMDSKEGDILTFGRYEQDNNPDNGPEEIEWIVLSNADGRVLLVSRQILEVRSYSRDEEDGLDVETWLDTAFREKAFGENEIGSVSKVTLLARQDVDNYTLSDGNFTNYAKAQDPDMDYTGQYYWWLRGITTSFGGVDAPIMHEGDTYVINHISDASNEAGVRPAVWLFGNPDESEASSGDVASAETMPPPEELPAIEEEAAATEPLEEVPAAPEG